MEIESTEAVVLEVLQRASSQNAQILKPAEAKLLEWETQPGFYTVLYVNTSIHSKIIAVFINQFYFQKILSNHSIDVNVRWISVLYIKNGIDKYWRKNAPK